MRPESAATKCAVRHVLAGKSGVRRAAMIFGIARSTLQRALKRRKKEAQCPHCYGAGFVEVTFDFSEMEDIRVECSACRRKAKCVESDLRY